MPIGGGSLFKIAHFQNRPPLNSEPATKGQTRPAPAGERERSVKRERKELRFIGKFPSVEKRTSPSAGPRPNREAGVNEGGTLRNEDAEKTPVGLNKALVSGGERGRAVHHQVAREDLRAPTGLVALELVMAPRACWKGYLKLFLVSCPIALFPARRSGRRSASAYAGQDPLVNRGSLYKIAH